jgi:arylsulfatase A-like enzyme
VVLVGRQNVSTPHIDRLAERGLKLTQWISAAPICTPSRVGLQTGRLAVRIGMTANVLPFRVFDWPSQSGGLPEAEFTVAEALQQAGYRTGMGGGWILGLC